MKLNREDVVAELIGDKDPKNQTRLILSRDHLFMEWEQKKNKGRKGYHFKYLSPHLGYSEISNQKSKYRLISGASILAVSVVLLFSVIQNLFPLLAPVLLILSGWLLYAGMKEYKTEKWTVYANWQGEKVAWIEHSQCDELKRLEFEDIYTKELKNFHDKYENK